MSHRKPILKCNLSCRIILRPYWYLHIFVSHPPQHIEECMLSPFILNRTVQVLTSCLLPLQKFGSEKTAEAQLSSQRKLHKEI